MAGSGQGGCLGDFGLYSSIMTPVVGRKMLGVVAAKRLGAPLNLQRQQGFGAAIAATNGEDHQTSSLEAAQPRLASQIRWRAPPRLPLARALTSSTSNPACFRRRVKASSGWADHTARLPPGFSAALVAASPLAE
jgi:hypothetical protein